MILLGIETATETLSVAVARDGACLGEKFIRMKNMHDRLLAHCVSTLLEDLQLAPEQIEGVAVSAGPGSFTGLRIGMSFAKGFAAGRGIPLAAVPTFDGVARAVASLGGWDRGTELAVLFDARREDVYVGTYRLAGGEFESIRPAEAAHMSGILAAVPPTMLLAGNGAEKFARFAGKSYRILGGEWAECHASTIAQVGEAMIARGATADVAECEPFYARDFHVRRSA